MIPVKIDDFGKGMESLISNYVRPTPHVDNVVRKLGTLQGILSAQKKNFRYRYNGPQKIP